MSKHEKTLRRTRRKTDDARRKRARAHSALRHPTSHIRHGAAVLAAAAAIAAGTSAYADQVRFDNPPGAGHFVWFDGPVNVGKGLDVTLSAADQTGDLNTMPGQFHQVRNAAETSAFVSAGTTGGSLELGGAYDLFLLGADAGDLIPTGATWGNVGYSYYPGFGSQGSIPFLVEIPIGSV